MIVKSMKNLSVAFSFHSGGVRVQRESCVKRGYTWNPEDMNIKLKWKSES